jgi:hypothetical protein
MLEEAVRQRLPASLARLIRTRYRNAATLGKLLHEGVANQVDDTGKKAVHQALLSKYKARALLAASTARTRTSLAGVN